MKQLEFKTDEDFAMAEKIAKRLGYRQTTYSTSSDLIGLYCLSESATHKAGCVIKTAELGFLFVQCLEDLRFYDLHEKQVESFRRAKTN